MARSRCFPPSLLDDPDYFERDGDTQAILIGLVLCADDHGRGMAHTNWLARKLNRDTRVIEAALTQLQTHRLVECYQVDQQRYYVLCKWWEWQSGLRNPARSKYPDPPTHVDLDSTSEKGSRSFSEKVGEPSRNSEEGGIPTREVEVEVEEELEREVEVEEELEREGERPSSNIVAFPLPIRDDDTDGEVQKREERGAESQIAHILQVPLSEALLRVVQDYSHDRTLSLLGEADAAREWIDDPRRNRAGKTMSVTFFRNWLKRERQAVQATGTDGSAHSEAPAARSSPGATTRRKSLMGLEAEYRAACEPRKGK